MNDFHFLGRKKKTKREDKNIRLMNLFKDITDLKCRETNVAAVPTEPLINIAPEQSRGGPLVDNNYLIIRYHCFILYKVNIFVFLY